jgi:hypothetical protein
MLSRLRFQVKTQSVKLCAARLRTRGSRKAIDPFGNKPQMQFHNRGRLPEEGRRIGRVSIGRAAKSTGCCSFIAACGTEPAAIAYGQRFRCLSALKDIR